MDRHAELQRLRQGPTEKEARDRRPSLGVLRVEAAHDIRIVLERAADVMKTIVESSVAGWDPGAVLIALPPWLRHRFAPDPSDQELEVWLSWWRRHTHDERAAAEKERGWTADDWLFWMDPKERPWSWWDVQSLTLNSGEIRVEVEGWPAPTGSLAFLLDSAGALSVETL